MKKYLNFKGNFFLSFIIFIGSELSTIKKAVASQGIIDFKQELGMAEGRGYDTLSGEVKGDCVIRTPLETVGKGSATSVIFSLTHIENYNSLARELDISTSASLLDVSSAKASFLKSIEINDYSIYALAQVKVTNSTQFMREVELAKSTYNLLGNRGAEAFRNRCGDAFISGYTSGGELYSLIEISTNSEQEKKEISASISGNFINFSGAVEFKEVLQKISKKNKVNIYLLRMGGNHSLPIQITPEEMVAAATNFPSQIKESPFIYKATLTKYENLILPDEKNIIDVTFQQDVLNYLLENQLRFNQMLSNIDYILNHKDQFDNLDEISLTDTKNKISNNINIIHETARSCYKKMDTCNYITNFDPLNVQWPKRVQFSSEEQLIQANESLLKSQVESRKAQLDLENARKQTDEAIAAANREKIKAKEAEAQANEQKALADKLKRDAEEALREAQKKREEAEAAAREAQAAAQAAREAAARAAEQAAKEEEKRKIGIGILAPVLIPVLPFIHL